VRTKRTGVKRKKPRRKSVARWFAELDKLNVEPFMKGGCRQPKAPCRKVF